LFANKEKFGLRYCDAKPNFFGKGFTYNGSSNLRELHVKISPFYLRRLKKHVLKELPPKTINMLNYDLSKDELKFYKHLLSVGKNEVDPTKPKKFSYLQLTTKLKQFLSLQKVKHAKEFVDQILEETTSKVIIFAQFIESQNKLVETFGEDISCSILGKDKSEDRMNILDEFSNNPNKRVLIASTKAAGIGLNITAADKIVFLDLLWSPSDLEQAEDRAHRMGQKLPVDIYYLIYNDTVENILWSILDKKRDIQAQIMDGRNNKNLASEDDVIKEFLEKFSLVLNQRKDA
jgi:SWI/SNF-related matrix-associated actin-dependent regulator 1 of chromatin subfamily A